MDRQFPESDIASLPPTSSLIKPRLLKPGEVKVKVGNFVGSAMLILNAGEYNTRDEKGVLSRNLQAWMLGGSARLFSIDPIKELGWFDFRTEPDGTNEAKFSISKEAIPQLMETFSQETSQIIESDPYREISEELGTELLTGRIDKPILKPSEISQIRTRYRGMVMYLTSCSEDEGMNLHINRVFDSRIPKDIKKKLLKARSVIYTPTQQEFEKWEIKRNKETIFIARKARLIHRFLKGESHPDGEWWIRSVLSFRAS